MKKYILTTALLAALVLSCTVSCTNADPSNGEGAGPDTQPVETSPYLDDLPADLKFGNETVNITVGDYSSAYWDDMYSEERTGNRFNEAVYDAILAVEERLEVDLEYTRKEYAWGNRNTHYSSIIGQILANDSAFDLLFDGIDYRAQMEEGEYFVNLAETAYINLDQPWYNQSLIENAPTEYIHSVVGDFSIGNLKNSFIIYFNQDLLDASGITEDLYSVVDSGNWTFDKLEALLNDTYVDDGNTVRDANDRYGLTFGDQNKYYGFTNAFGMHAFDKTADEYEFVLDNERNVTAFQTIVEFINSNENVLASRRLDPGLDADYEISSSGGNTVSKLFVDGNALFTVSLIADAPSIIPEIDFEFGILPLPKLDDVQENYANGLQRIFFAMIPTTCADTDRSSAVLEALTSQFYSSVIPEYVEVTLKTRYSPTDNISRMFDIATDAITFYPDALYGSSVTLPDTKINIVNNNPNWVSIVASVKPAVLEHLGTLDSKD